MVAEDKAPLLQQSSLRASGALLRLERREKAMADNEDKRTLDLLRYYLLGSKFEK